MRKLLWCVLLTLSSCIDGPIPLTSLGETARAGWTEEVKKKVEAGEDINGHLSNGITPLMAAAQGGQYEIVDYLLKKGADPNLKNHRGFTALDLADDGLAAGNDESLAKEPHVAGLSPRNYAKTVQLLEKVTTVERKKAHQ